MAAKFIRNKPFQYRDKGKSLETDEKPRRFVKEDEACYFWNTSLGFVDEPKDSKRTNSKDDDHSR